MYKIYTLNTIICIYLLISTPVLSTKNVCTIKEFLSTIYLCSKYDYYQQSHDQPVQQPEIVNNLNNFYIIFNVNHVEGFNLRRDVYVRMIVFIKTLRKLNNYNRTTLVLSPFSRLYHWRTNRINQTQIFWNHFFDLDSLQKYTQILDIWEFFTEIKKWKIFNRPVQQTHENVNIDYVFSLQNFPDMFENGKFIEKFQITNCTTEKLKPNPQSTFLLGYNNITTNNFQCVNYQGSVMLLQQLFEKHVKRNIRGPTIVLIQHTETVLHEHFGDAEFWRARRSMRFNGNLIQIANKYRKEKFNSTNYGDLIQRPNDWRNDRLYRNAIGGNYICAHLRRADFLYGRERTTPTLRSAAIQIKNLLKMLQLRNVFISSDCSKQEFKDLQSYLVRFKIFRFTMESNEQLEAIKDGGIAIIDQIICSHAMYFIGTYESTFTYRIYEEREILGFPKDKTFNTFCKYDYDMKNCSKNSIWPIVY